MPHHGSLQYWPHRRARKRLPRERSHPTITTQTLGNIIAYKVGMTQLSMIDDSESPSKQMDVLRPCTVLEVPRMEVYGIRLYSIDKVTGYKRASMEIYNKASAQKMNRQKIKNDESKIEQLKPKLKEFTNIVALIIADPKELSADQNHVVKFEAPVGGKTIEEKLEYATKILGKEIKVSDLFKAGEFIDATSISKGKGWQGPVRRFHVHTLQRKATGKRRHIGAHGAFTPGKVFFSVPQAGQLGFNYRTEHNKRILKLGTKTEADQINNLSGFTNYGKVDNDYIVIAGSIPGPAKRLVRIRKSIRERNIKGIKEPKITYIAK